GGVAPRDGEAGAPHARRRERADSRHPLAGEKGEGGSGADDAVEGEGQRAEREPPGDDRAVAGRGGGGGEEAAGGRGAEIGPAERAQSQRRAQALDAGFPVATSTLPIGSTT